eukprot:Skav217945  [mRNA]  locus=scaffold2100:108801:113011:+ [translate_table: standard]
MVVSFGALAQSPWSGYASPCWWETMKRPTYEDSDSEDHPAFDSEDEASLDRFFQSTVRNQTTEMAEVLLSALEGKTCTLPALMAGCLRANPKCALAEALLRGPEAFGRLMGLLRVNAMALHAFRSPEAAPEDLVKGMAIYSAARLQSRGPDPSEVVGGYVCSDPAEPQRCLVRTLRPIKPEEELLSGRKGAAEVVHRLSPGLPLHCRAEESGAAPTVRHRGTEKSELDGPDILC